MMERTIPVNVNESLVVIDEVRWRVTMEFADVWLLEGQAHGTPKEG
jgi:hypothetical protein